MGLENEQCQVNRKERQRGYKILHSQVKYAIRLGQGRGGQAAGQGELSRGRVLLLRIYQLPPLGVSRV